MTPGKDILCLLGEYFKDILKSKIWTLGNTTGIRKSYYPKKTHFM